MADFVDFAGVAERRGDTIRLVSQGNNGTLQFAADDVKLENNRIAVRLGAVAIAVDEPGDSKVEDRQPADTLRNTCPSGITCCIGSVHICCDDFRVIGTCIGAWGCARARFIH